VRARKANSNIGAGAFHRTVGAAGRRCVEQGRQHGEPRQDFPQSSIQEFKVYLSPVTRRIRMDRWAAPCRWPPRAARIRFTAKASSSTATKALNTIDPVRQGRGQAKPTSAGISSAAPSAARIARDKVHFFQAAERLKSNLYDNVVVSCRSSTAAQRVFPSPEYNKHVVHARRLADRSKQNPVRALRLAGVGLSRAKGARRRQSNPWFSGGGGIKQHRYAWAVHTPGC
jgi:hypothetical protein